MIVRLANALPVLVGGFMWGRNRRKVRRLTARLAAIKACVLDHSYELGQAQPLAVEVLELVDEPRP